MPDVPRSDSDAASGTPIRKISQITHPVAFFLQDLANRIGSVSAWFGASDSSYVSGAPNRFEESSESSPGSFSKTSQVTKIARLGLPTRFRCRFSPCVPDSGFETRKFSKRNPFWSISDCRRSQKSKTRLARIAPCAFHARIPPPRKSSRKAPRKAPHYSRAFPRQGSAPVFGLPRFLKRPVPK